MVSVPQDLKRRRMELGLSQADLARRADVSSRTIWRIEHGEVESVGESVAKKIESVLAGQPVVEESHSLAYVTIEDLEMLLGVAKVTGGKLKFSTAIQLILDTRTLSIPPPI